MANDYSFQQLSLRPGVITELTPYAAQGDFVASNYVRFRNGQAQQIGGWQLLNSFPLLLDGVCRQMRAFESLDQLDWLALGTNRRLYIESNATYDDITPIASTFTESNPFTTSVGLTSVNVNVPANGQSAGDIVFFPATSTGGGVTINGAYNIDTIVDPNNFTITASNAATSSATFGGAGVVIEFYIPTGPSDQSIGFGYGAGLYGQGLYGTQSSGSGVSLNLVQWTFDNFGENLIANQFGGSIYIWIRADYPARAVLIPQAPLISNTILITQDRFLISYGGSDPGATTNFDPLLIQWSTQGDYTTWTPSETNTAGQYRINTANKILTAKICGQNILVWTDLDLYTQQPLNAPLVFGFSQSGTGCGPISKNAVVVYNGIAYWMGQQEFYTYNASMAPLPCTVLREVFSNINYTQNEKIFAVVNSGFNEIWFFYVSTASTEIDSYVIYNFLENTWALGSGLIRTAAIDISVITPANPIMCDQTGVLWVHESGTTANGQPIPSTILTAPIDISPGEMVGFSRRFLPDFFLPNGANVNITLIGLPYSDANDPVVKGPYAIGQYTQTIDYRLKARQIQIQVSGINGYWQFGKPRIDVRPQGYR